MPVPMPDTAGVVYVYSIEGVPGRVKIGYTTKAYWPDRIAEQRHAGTPGAQHIHFACRVDDARTLEREMHVKLYTRQVKGASPEWFEIEPSELVRMFPVLVNSNVIG